MSGEEMELPVPAAHLNGLTGEGIEDKEEEEPTVEIFRACANPGMCGGHPLY